MIYTSCHLQHAKTINHSLTFSWWKYIISDTDLGGTKTHFGKTGKSLVELFYKQFEQEKAF